MAAFFAQFLNNLIYIFEEENNNLSQIKNILPVEKMLRYLLFRLSKLLLKNFDSVLRYANKLK